MHAGGVIGVVHAGATLHEHLYELWNFVISALKQLLAHERLDLPEIARLSLAVRAVGGRHRQQLLELDESVLLEKGRRRLGGIVQLPRILYRDRTCLFLLVLSRLARWSLASRAELRC